RNHSPSGSSVTFKNTSYFSRNGQNVDFPTPSRILAESAIQAPSFQDCEERPPVYFKELGLVVNAFGPWKQVVPHVPVPEVYGWTQDTKYTYLFIEFVHGVTLEKIWDSLPHCVPFSKSQTIAFQVGTVVHLQATIFTNSSNAGHVNRGPLTDVVFTGGNLPPAGPFFSVTAFHDWLSSMLTKDKGQHWLGIDPSDIPDPYRQGLPDDSSVVFTHPDLHPSNIIVFTESPPVSLL
ncbi:phosphotransferase enzyme family protein-like protein, partial [Apiospora saccharicola]